MKRFFLLAAILCAAMSANAKSLVLNLKSGTKVYYLLGTGVNPVMRFDGGEMTINADTYTISRVKSFNISETDDPTSIQQLEISKVRPGSFLINSADAGKVRVYKLDGTQVEAGIENQGGSVIVCLDGLDSGIYIINVGSESLKVMKK